jgi:hypothetical protein
MMHEKYHGQTSFDLKEFGEAGGLSEGHYYRY